MRQTKAKRKLLPERALSDIVTGVDLGIPLSRVIRDKNLTVNRMTVTKLVDWYRFLQASFSIKAKGKDVLRNSLFPPWLDPLAKDAQVNDDDWYYIGRFPWGEWKHRTSNDETK